MTVLPFVPLPGLSSKHLQTILPSFFPTGDPPPSTSRRIDLGDGDALCCEVSTPPDWAPPRQTVLLLHGLSGNHTSPYMIRLARKIYESGDRAVRINLRGTGTGVGLSKLPYHGGNSEDLGKVLRSFQAETPGSPLLPIGFSLGGNIVLKLAGELGADAASLVKGFIAVCPPLELERSVRIIEERRHSFYNFFYVFGLRSQARRWTQKRLATLHDFDDQITAPLWRYRNAKHYYDDCSSLRFLPSIRHTTHLVFSQDDPFVPLDALPATLPTAVRLFFTTYGGHMGFLGKTARPRDYHWMDQQLLQWIGETPS